MCDDLLKPPKRPCGSCPYRRDVPSGVWAKNEYAKLPAYDAETWAQPPEVFMCHQRDGCVCGGWLQTHDTDHLLALRLAAARVDPACFGYESDVPTFASGTDAAIHGLRDIHTPGPEARELMRKISPVIRSIPQRERRY